MLALVKRDANKKMNAINQFIGDYRFLSNFHPCTIEFQGISYPSVEHFYVAMKTVDVDIRRHISNMVNAGEVKRFGRTIKVRADWDQVKLITMKFGVKKKFEDHNLKKLLLSTGDAELIEGNNWGDTFWGVDLRTGVGENNLGKILMEIRSESL